MLRYLEDKFTLHNGYNVIKRLNNLSRVFCLCPLGENLDLSLPWTIYSMLFPLFYTYISIVYYTVFKYHERYASLSKGEFFVYVYIYFMNHFSMFILLYLISMAKLNHYKSFVGDLLKVEEILKRSCAQIEYKLGRWFVITLFRIFILMCILVEVEMRYSRHSFTDLLNAVIHISPLIFQEQIFNEFVICLALNTGLLKAASSLVDAGRLEAASEAHRTLSKSSAILSKIYSPVLLLLLASNLLLILSSFHYTLGQVIRLNVPFTLTGIIWIFILTFNCKFICNTCESYSVMAEKFTNNLYTVMINDVGSEIYNNEILQLHLLMKNKVVFTACGLFNLDNTLFHSMVWAATTYIFIFIQFQPLQIEK